PAELSADDILRSKADTAEADDIESTSNKFDPATISELQWEQWRASILRHGLEKEKLGRFATSLQNMTRVIWNTPLSEYAIYTLAEIRALKTHGEKRTNAILHVFHCLNTLVVNMGNQDNLVVRIIPKLIDHVEKWIGQALQKPGVPEEQEIFQNFINPLLEQIRIDATKQIVALAENRLGIHGPITSIRQLARTMGFTRARIYQLLNEINDILAVRWPLGCRWVHELNSKFASEAADQQPTASLERFYAAVELFYPSNRRGAVTPLGRVAVVPDINDNMIEV
ncbi:MAG TPA: hypothetical protein VIH42_08655, partial [Thermoguttaceae bacterium]